MTTNTGGSAFPYVADADFDYGTGMTLRDYFAAKALQGLLSDTTVRSTPDEFASNCYIVADAMLKARES